MKKKNITFLVNSCDDYDDIWTPFFTALKKYWINFDFPIILNTESKNFAFNALDIKCYGSSSHKWGGRFLEHLNKVETEYVINFFDDYLVNKYVDILKIENCISILEEHRDISVCYLVDIMQHEGAHPPIKNKVDCKQVQLQNASFQVIPTSQNYRLNSAPAIWRVADLIKFTRAGDTPWVWEFFGSARTYKTSNRFLCVAAGESDIVSYVNDRGMGGAIHRGDWLVSAVQFIEENLGLRINNNTHRSIKVSARNQSHSFKWKINFLIDGFKAVGFDCFIFISRSIIKKCSKLFSTG